MGDEGQQHINDCDDPKNGGSVDLPPELWQAVIQRLGTVGAQRVPAVARAFETGRCVALETTKNAMRRGPCATVESYTRAMLVAIAMDNVEDVASLLLAGPSQPHLPLAPWHIIESAIAGALKVVVIVGEPYETRRIMPTDDPRSWPAAIRCDPTPLALAAMMRAPYTIRFLGARGVRPIKGAVARAIKIALDENHATRRLTVRSRRDDSIERDVVTPEKTLVALAESFAPAPFAAFAIGEHPLDALAKVAMTLAMSTIHHCPSYSNPGDLASAVFRGAGPLVTVGRVRMLARMFADCAQDSLLGVAVKLNSAIEAHVDATMCRLGWAAMARALFHTGYDAHDMYKADHGDSLGPQNDTPIAWLTTQRNTLLAQTPTNYRHLFEMGAKASVADRLLGLYVSCCGPAC